MSFHLTNICRVNKFALEARKGVLGLQFSMYPTRYTYMYIYRFLNLGGMRDVLTALGLVRLVLTVLDHVAAIVRRNAVRLVKHILAAI